MLSSVPLQRSRYPSQTQGSGVATPENQILAGLLLLAPISMAGCYCYSYSSRLIIIGCDHNYSVCEYNFQL